MRVNPEEFFQQGTPVRVRGRLVSDDAEQGYRLVEPEFGQHAVNLECDADSVPLGTDSHETTVDLFGLVGPNRLHIRAVAPASSGRNRLESSMDTLRTKVLAQCPSRPREGATTAEELAGMVDPLRKEGLVVAATRFRLSPSRAVLTVSTTEPELVASRLNGAVRDGLIVVLRSRWGHAALDAARAAVAEIDEGRIIATGEGINDKGELFVHVKTTGPVPVNFKRTRAPINDDVLRVESWISPGIREFTDGAFLRRQ